MPAFAGENLFQQQTTSAASSFDHLPRKSNDKSLGGVFTLTNGGADTGFADQRSDQYRAALKNQNLHALSNGTPNGSIRGRERSHSKAGSIQSMSSVKSKYADNERSNYTPRDASKYAGSDYFGGLQPNGTAQYSPRQSVSSGRMMTNGDQAASPLSQSLESTTAPITGISSMTPDQLGGEPTDYLNVPSHTSNRHSSPPPPTSTALQPTISSTSTGSAHPRLSHRHTLQVPRVSTTRTSRDFSFSTSGPAEDGPSNSGRLSPTHPSYRRASLGLARRTTRSIASDLHLDEVPQDEDALRWTEAIRQKRASRRRRKEDEDDDRVIVGTKVDQGHVNFVTAYNMLTGIRFTVSRTNAKMDRELTDADFNARHKFSFDITGNELTPSAKYDFKFKDYAPWVFRHLRAKFGIDPADYLMSLTSKYILSELGSPGKSGSFFYFSRDYKYIIKTIHHAEHKLLRKILKDYYQHICDNPNTLISQFYGLHRVKIPYGRKIHFVVMNNLFPPHRDIHQTFDLKGSTVGRDFREEDLEKNPRATLKDLNWLRRNLHLEFGPGKKEVFIRQMERDVALLQRLKIMDYSLLVGIHDLEKGNEEKLRDKTLQVFQPGGERPTEEAMAQLSRTPSRMETLRQAQELRKTLRKEKPIPMGMSQSKMPEEMLDDRKDKVFYSDDGGFSATHEDGSQGEEIYYLGIIDCLTHYGIVKKGEHFWKGLRDNASQISPIPPVQYGQRFVNFIKGVTMPREEVERRAQRASQSQGQSVDLPGVSGHIASSETNRSSADMQNTEGLKSPVDKTMYKAQKQADKSERHGRSEDTLPDRTIMAVKSPTGGPNSGNNSGGGGGGPSMTLPVVEERDNEAASTGGRSGRSNMSQQLHDLDTVNGASSGYTAATSDANASAFSESPDDYRAYEQYSHSSSEKHTGVNTNKSLPSIPRLKPSYADSIERAVDPEKMESSPNNNVEGTVDGHGHDKRSFATSKQPFGRWGASR